MDHDHEVLLSARRFRVVTRVHRTADGRQHAREIVEHPGSVVILPVLEGNRVCLIRNFRIAVDRALFELPAGTLDLPDEDTATAAARELAEETGYRAQSLDHLLSFYVSPGILNERMHLFVATGLSEGPTALEGGEEIERVIVAWDEALAMVRDGRIEDAKSLVGLLYYERWRAG